MKRTLFGLGLLEQNIGLMAQFLIVRLDSVVAPITGEVLRLVTRSRGLRWVVNNGRHVSFWHDKWVGDSTIRELVQGPLTPGKNLLKVCDVIEGVSLWGLSKISFPLPSPLLAQIKAINLCTLSSRKDCVAWGSPDDAFNLRKAYLVASNFTHLLPNRIHPTGSGKQFLALGFCSFFGNVTIIVCLCGAPLLLEEWLFLLRAFVVLTL
jgi:hypothetical protein